MQSSIAAPFNYSILYYNYYTIGNLEMSDKTRNELQNIYYIYHTIPNPKKIEILYK